MTKSILLSVIAFLCIQAEGGELRSNTYHTLEVDAVNTCSTGKTAALLDEKENALANLCLADYLQCLMEGACIVKAGEETHLINVVKVDRKSQRGRWRELNPGLCPYGLGSGQICLDPFYSVAADLEAYQLGDVIFIEKLKGLQLPNGEIHDGFVIVRDTNNSFADGVGDSRILIFGGAVKIGQKSLLDLAGFDNIRTKFAFRKATTEEAELVRKNRKFPLMPESILELGAGQ